MATTKQECQSKKTTPQQKFKQQEVIPQQLRQRLTSQQKQTIYKRNIEQLNLCRDDFYKFQSLPCTWKKAILGSNYCTFSL
jgi:hypothetical protein